jgi:hypothetical protein
VEHSGDGTGVAIRRDEPLQTPAVPPAGGLVRDSHPIFETRFSCRELVRLMGIALDWAMAAQIALKAVHQPNVF